MNKGGACGEREFRGRGGNFCAPLTSQEIGKSFGSGDRKVDSTGGKSIS